MATTDLVRQSVALRSTLLSLASELMEWRALLLEQQATELRVRQEVLARAYEALATLDAAKRRIGR